MAQIYYHANDNRITVRDLRDPTRPAASRYLNEGVTVSVRVLREGREVPVTSGVLNWPVELEYEAGSDGVYAVILPATLDVKPGRYCVAEIIVTGALGTNARWLEPLVIQQRGGAA